LVERFDLGILFGRDAIDIEDFLEARALSAAMALDQAADEDALAEAELLDHRAGHEGVGSLAREVGLRIAQKAVPVGMHFEHARSAHERQRLAILVDFEIGPTSILAIGRRTVG